MLINSIESILQIKTLNCFKYYRYFKNMVIISYSFMIKCD